MNRVKAKSVMKIMLALFGLGFLIRGVLLFQTSTIIVQWSTASELDTAGFYLYRGMEPSGPFEKITPNLISASLDPLSGGSYKFSDSSVDPWITYYYELEAIGLDGTSDRFGPIIVKAQPSGVLDLALAIVIVVIVGLIQKTDRTRLDLVLNDHA